MKETKEILFYLKQFIAILKKEKKALINNKNEKIVEIIQLKEEFIPVFDSFEPTDSEEIRMLVSEIKELQSTNLMLTEQAMAYNNVYLQAIASETKRATNTYSSDGKFTERKEVNFIEQTF
ncbi:hypothetical protein [Vagococcus sp.]|uniref:hypothetical protein n=1 Tax=Vagococcus sp. TaxID=1933889 RepID=UPI003F958431